MPIIEISSYKRPPSHHFNAHLQTILPNLRQIKGVVYDRERLELPDGDFVDLDWLQRGHSKLILLSHGLEGNSDRAYMLAAAKFFKARGWDVVAWNCRSCSGELNRTTRMYHHGETGDIRQVIAHILANYRYDQIGLVGYSLGGSIILNYLGRHPEEVPPEVIGGVAFSVPCDLRSCAARLDEFQNIVYKKLFKRSLTKKFNAKNKQFPGLVPMEKLKLVKQWFDFDNYLSAPAIGFRDANDYYSSASSFRHLSQIRKPALLVNALNDPILQGDCYPTALAAKSKSLFLEMPRFGGHVGFMMPKEKEYSWMEFRALAFFEEHITPQNTYPAPLSLSPSPYRDNQI